MKTEWTFERDPETGSRLELDGYNETLRMAFEYNGKQHYETVPHIVVDLEAVMHRDSVKASLCAKAGIRLITIPYWIKDLRSFIERSLREDVAA